MSSATIEEVGLDFEKDTSDSDILDYRDEEMGPWALLQYMDKYSWKDENEEPIEVWPDTAYRVVRHVLGALNYTDKDPEFQALVKMIVQRKFIPGGRYLASSGRTIHQTNNCFLFRCEDSREGWADLVHKAIMSLSSGGGIGSVYSDVRPYGTLIQKTGGFATGPLSPAKMVNEIARHVMQGGHRRSAIWAGLHWNHKDIFKWIEAKDWSPEIVTAKEAAVAQGGEAPAPLDMTNISVILDDDFFAAFDDVSHEQHMLAQDVYYKTCEHMVATGEPGFSIDVGDNVKENLRNAPVAGETYVMTTNGYRQVSEIVDEPVSVWTGSRWTDDVVFSQTGEDVPTVTVKMTGGRELRCDPMHEFLVERWIGAGSRRQLDGIEKVAAKDLQSGDQLHVSLPHQPWIPSTLFDEEAYTFGFIYGDGSFTKAGGAELTLCTAESKACASSITGANHVTETDARGYTRMYFSVNDRFRGRSKSAFPDDLLDEDGAIIGSFLAGLFDADGNWEPTQKRIRLASKHRGFLRGIARALEQLGILAHVSKAGTSTYGKAQGYQLVIAADQNEAFATHVPTQRLKIDLCDYQAYRPSYVKVVDVESAPTADVFCADVRVPEHSFMAEGVIISNCTEITSEDDSDVCNLGSINMARIESREEFAEVIRLATLFLIAGTVYSDVPYEKVKEIRAKNRRLGLGLMGLHEWLLVRGYRYEMVDELREWLDEYALSTSIAAKWADKHKLSHPVKTRAIAPNGTIGIIGETTTSAEPIFCVAYKRRFLDSTDGKWKYQYVIDPTAHRLIESGVNPDDVEDAYALSYNVERRIKFQADLQEYVDHGIASTINLPYPITDPHEAYDFAQTLYQYLPRLRGVTVYPNGARAGQPLEAVAYEQVIGRTGITFEESGRDEQCRNGACGV
jgi:ribonucleotide reductase alpha subunit